MYPTQAKKKPTGSFWDGLFPSFKLVWVLNGPKNYHNPLFKMLQASGEVSNCSGRVSEAW